MLVAGCTAAIATPTTVDFELAPPLTVVGPTQPDTSYTESGVRFTPSGNDAIVDLSFCLIGGESCISNNDSVYLTALNGAEVTVKTGRIFSLVGLDAAFFPLPDPVGLFSGFGFGLKLTGTKWAGGTVEQTVRLAEDTASPGDFLFSRYAGAVDFDALASLTLGACWFDGPSCVRGGTAFDDFGVLTNDLQFAVDNLQLEAPEPSALWLVGLSLAALALTRRRVA